MRYRVASSKAGAPRPRLAEGLPKGWCTLAVDQQEQCRSSADRGLTRKGLCGSGGRDETGGCSVLRERSLRDHRLDGRDHDSSHGSRTFQRIRSVGVLQRCFRPPETRCAALRGGKQARRIELAAGADVMQI